MFSVDPIIFLISSSAVLITFAAHASRDILLLTTFVMNKINKKNPTTPAEVKPMVIITTPNKHYFASHNPARQWQRFLKYQIALHLPSCAAKEDAMPPELTDGIVKVNFLLFTGFLGCSTYFKYDIGV